MQTKLANALYAMGHFEDAAALFLKSIDASTTLFGPKHAVTISTPSFSAPLQKSAIAGGRRSVLDTYGSKRANGCAKSTS